MHNVATAPAAETLPASKPLPRVRLATPADLDGLLEMGRELHRENGLMSLDEGMIRQAAEGALLHNRDTFGVIGKPGHLEAMIYLGLRQFWYSKDVHLEELLAYVSPNFRKSRNAIALIEFAKASALKLGVPLLIGIISSTNTKQKIKLYERRIGPMSGAYFLFNGKTCS